MQLRIGYPAGNTTCAVTNGNQIVTAAAGSDWSQAVSGGFFSRDVEGDPIYEIAAVRAPGVNASGKWELTLTGNYQGATDAALAYLIHKDFFGNGTPMWNKGDTQFFAIQNRVNAMLDRLVGGVGTIIPSIFANVQASPTDGKFQILNPDTGLFFTAEVRGPPGGVVISLAEVGEGSSGSMQFTNTQESPADQSFQIRNPDQNKYFTVQVRGNIGEKPRLEIIEPGVP